MHPQTEDAKELAMKNVNVNGKSVVMPSSFDERKVVGVSEAAPSWVKDGVRELMEKKRYSLKMAINELKRSPFFSDNFLQFQ